MVFDFAKGYENENLEFKIQVPDDSIKYTKTVSAFSNSNGGLIVFGVEDTSHQIAGIPDDSLFSSIDRITNAISDNVEPLPDFSVSIVPSQGKNLIVVEVQKGLRRPYHIKGLGYENGTFVRVGATTRLADSEIVSTWYFEGRNESWDSLEYGNHVIEEAEMETFHRLTGNTITEAMMRSWGLFHERNGVKIASNAFCLLCGTYSSSPLVHCAVFRGKKKGEFLDKKILEGSVLEQYEGAVRFIKANTRMTARVVGQLRIEKPEIPDSVIRELVVNAIVHRSYISYQASYIAIYSDRIEVITPGGLPGSLTVERVKQGFSKIRNRTIARVFMHLNLMDGYGMGIPAMIEELKKNGLAEPLIEDLGDYMKLTVFRQNPYDEMQEEDSFLVSETPGPYVAKVNYENAIVLLIKQNPEITLSEIAQRTNLSLSTVKREIARLQASGTIIRQGNNRRGIWQVVSWKSVQN